MENGLIHRDLRSENILIKEKFIGANKYSDDENQCPYSIQIVNFGHTPQYSVEDLLNKNSFSKLYCVPPEKILNN